LLALSWLTPARPPFPVPPLLGVASWGDRGVGRAVAVVVTLAYLSGLIRQAKEATRQATEQRRGELALSAETYLCVDSDTRSWRLDGCTTTPCLRR
jgi:hypothetical protein